MVRPLLGYTFDQVYYGKWELRFKKRKFLVYQLGGTALFMYYSNRPAYLSRFARLGLCPDVSGRPQIGSSQSVNFASVQSSA